MQNRPDFGFRGFDPETAEYIEVVGPTGKVAAGAAIPIDASIKATATGQETGVYIRTSVIQGHHWREVVAPLLPPFTGAVVVAAQVDNLYHDLHRLRLILILVTLGGIVAAAAGGALVSRTTLAPVRRLTDATERVARTRDPSERVPEGGHDEIARLGASFNTMLAALEDAIETQRRFVADASHELRTPLTSMQTNLEVLRRPAGSVQLDPESRERLLEDLQREAHEMRDLVGGLLELARGDDPRLERATVQLDELVEESVERARSRFPKIFFDTALDPTTVVGSPDRLERAVWNLLENAGKWSPEGETVEVKLTRRRADRPRPRPRHRAGRPAARLRPLLPLRRLPFDARLRARSRHRARDRRRPRRHRLGRRGAGRRRPDAAAAERRAQRLRAGFTYFLDQPHVGVICCESFIEPPLADPRGTHPAYQQTGAFRFPCRKAPSAGSPSPRPGRRLAAGEHERERRARRDGAFRVLGQPGGDGRLRDDRVAPLVELDQLRHELGAEPVRVARDRIHAQHVAHRTASGRRAGSGSTARSARELQRP